MHGGRHQGSPLGDLFMAKLELTSIGIVVKDLKKARSFYTRKIGLKVRESDPKMGYLALGATKGGKDAALNPWQPTPDWGDMYEPALKRIGEGTGIGFLTSDWKKTGPARTAKGRQASNR